jgi:hypothetical protein
MKIRTLVTLAALSFCANMAWADDYKVGQIEIDNLWVRASAPGQTNGAGYMEINNHGKAADRLLSVHSNAAERVELHTVRKENGMAEMRKIDSVEVPADSEVKLAPGGHHIMFIKLKTPFTEGAEIPAILKFEKAGIVSVKFKVKPTNHKGGMNMNDKASMNMNDKGDMNMNDKAGMNMNDKGSMNMNDKAGMNMNDKAGMNMNDKGDMNMNDSGSMKR